jgi:hypothetical protein
MPETRFAADVFFAAWSEQTSHLPCVLPITEIERARGTSAPMRAIGHAVADTYQHLHVILGHGPSEAHRQCDRFVDALVGWTRTDARDREVLRTALRAAERLHQVPAWALPLEVSDYPWLQV